MAEELPNECCVKCRFWGILDTQYANFIDDQDGTCRRFPPTAILPDLRDEDGGVDSLSRAYTWFFPATRGGDWCGEFEPQKKKPDTRLGVLNLGTRVLNGLECSGIETVEKLCTYSARELIRDARNVGRGGVAEIREALAKIGKSLKGD
jgi:hypothetical protein